MTPAERSFFGILHGSLSNDFSIFSKVRVSDVFLPTKGLTRSIRTIARNKIQSKHFDFVLCDKNTLGIVAVIELDDSSHQLSNRIERDQLIDAICLKTGIPIIRFNVKYAYQPEQVKKQVLSAITPIDS